VPPQPCLLLELLPESVLRTVMAYLSEEEVATFCFVCQSTVQYLHCVSSITITNASAISSLERRIKGEGIRHLVSLDFEEHGDLQFVSTSTSIPIHSHDASSVRSRGLPRRPL
jgi:hypothetical protein